jgi:transposase-like protein
MYTLFMDDPKTLQEAMVYFSDPERVFAYAVRLRWPDGVITCPRCKAAKKSFIKTRRLWFCYGCKKQFTIKVKTIFEDSPLGLDKWMVAFWMLANCKNGISSHELGKTLGIHQTSAWFMLQRIRKVMGGRSFRTQGRNQNKMGGEGTELEVDETYVGGKLRNMHKGRRLQVGINRTAQAVGQHPDRFPNKTAVMGIFDRDLRTVRAKVVPDVKRETLQNEVLKNVKYGSTVYTDDAVGYDKLHYRFVHDVVNHAEQYVKGRVHTNGLENFWSLLKRTLRGTYVAVEPFHLDRYVDEQVFRFNNRKGLNDAQRFAIAMSQVAGKRLTYAELTGKDADALHHEATGAGETQVPF